MGAHSEINDGGKAARKKIWLVFWILLGVTLFEVGLAFTSIPADIMKTTFILLTLVKAYYIVFYFMHLRDEKRSFAWAIILPMVLVAYAIFIILYEGHSLNITDKFFN